MSLAQPRPKRRERAATADAASRGGEQGGRVVLFNKPCGVLCQFSPAGSRPTLKNYVSLSGVYAAGRLDSDSEGLLVLTADGRLQRRIADPRHKLDKTYWVQVEGVPGDEALRALRQGLDLGDFRTLPCRARRIDEPAGLWSRQPPIRERKNIPTAWLELVIREGKNRQVRRMTAKVGLSTLRLIRWSVGPWTLAGLGPGQWRFADVPG